MANGRTERDLECTYFDIKKTCSVCGARPAMRKTGKCAPHSVDPYDPSREGDWVDCYEGCIKHDPAARRRYMSKTIDQKKRRTPKKTIKILLQEPAKIPTLDKLFMIHRHPPEVREERIAVLLYQAANTRGIGMATLEKALHMPTDYYRSRLLGRASKKRRFAPLSFMDVCDVVDYLRSYDKARKEGKI